MDEIRVGLVGYGFIGQVHNNAWRQVPFYFYDVKPKPVMKALCDVNAEQLKTRAVEDDWEVMETDFDRLLERDDIDLIDITTPNNLHVPMVIKAAQAGKHIFCEKPLAMSVAEAAEAVKAVQEAGVIHMVCHNYRRAPAVSLAKQMIDEGLLGQIYHWRAQYLQDWLLDPQAPMLWRMRKEIAGSGALGDLMAHSLDLALWLVGDIDRICCDMETFIKQRPMAEGTGIGGKAAQDAEMGTVTVDDGAVALARFANGAMGTFEATRFGAGHKNYNCFEINGSQGSLRFNMERMNELEYYNVEDGDQAGFRMIQTTEASHPFMHLASGAGRYWPPGHILGYEHTFFNTAADLLRGIASGENPRPNFEDGLKTQAVLEACGQSAEQGGWVKVPKV